MLYCESFSCNWKFSQMFYGKGFKACPEGKLQVYQYAMQATTYTISFKVFLLSIMKLLVFCLSFGLYFRWGHFDIELPLSNQTGTKTKKLTFKKPAICWSKDINCPNWPNELPSSRIQYRRISESSPGKKIYHLKPQLNCQLYVSFEGTVADFASASFSMRIIKQVVTAPARGRKDGAWRELKFHRHHHFGRYSNL